MDITAIQKKFDEMQSLQEQGEYESAANGYTALLQEVSHPLIANALGFCLKMMNKPEFAERVWITALQEKADCVPVLANLGNMYRERHRYDRAVELLDKALETAPDDFHANHNRSVLAMDMGDFALARVLSDKAVKLKADPAAVHTLSLAHLNCGDFEAGFKLYDIRHQAHNRQTPPLPKYEGGKAKLIVSHEQGLGDTIMAARWLPKLREMGADVYLSCPPSLHKLIEQSDLCKLHTPENTDYTHYLWTMDLLEMFSDNWSSLDPKTYLFSSENRGKEFAERLSAKPRIGICYSGGYRPDNLSSLQIDRRRSLSPSEAYQIVSSRPDAEWVNLTREWGLPDTTDFGSEIADFADLAALISNLDQVITVDTAVAHLAGGLGVDTLVLSRYDACWRWYPYTKQTPLYENMRVYFQPQPFDWQSVIDRVSSDIRKNR